MRAAFPAEGVRGSQERWVLSPACQRPTFGDMTSHLRTALVTLILAAVMLLGSSATGHAQDQLSTEQRNAQVVRDAFALGVGGEDTFYSILADDVQWTVARAAAPTTYTGREQFLRDGAGPIVARLNGPIRADVRELITDGDVVVALWDGTATARDGRPYVNRYAWVMTLRDERVVRVTAYLDLAALNDLLQRVGPA